MLMLNADSSLANVTHVSRQTITLITPNVNTHNTNESAFLGETSSWLVKFIEPLILIYCTVDLSSANITT